MTSSACALAFLAVLGSAQEKQLPIHVHGAVENHVVPCHPEEGVLEAITKAKVMAGADLANAIVIRSRQPSPLIIRIDLRRMIHTGDMTWNIQLAAGDVLFVPRHAEPAANTGAGTGSGAETDSDRPIFELLEALLETQPEATTIVSIHLHFATQHPETDVRRTHVLALGAMGRAAATAVPALSELARQQDRVAEDAITALGMVGPVAKDAIPTLDALVEHDEARLREPAKAALRAIRRGDDR